MYFIRFAPVIVLLLGCPVSVIQASDSVRFKASVVGILADDPELSYTSDIVVTALSWAVKEVSVIYPHIDFQIVYRNSSRKCYESFAGAFAAEEYYLREVSAFIGPGCTYALHQVGRMASYWNIPIYTAGGIDDSFSDKDIFNTLTRLSFSLDRVSSFLINTLKEFQWRHVVMLVDETNLREMLMSQSVERAFKREKMHEFYKQSYYFKSSTQNGSYSSLLKTAYSKSRVFILIAPGKTVRNLLLDAHTLGMEKGNCVFLGLELIKSKKVSSDFNWFQNGDNRNEEARKMYESLMVIAVRVPTSKDYKNFVRQITEGSVTESATKVEDIEVNPIVAAFYDCVLTYAWSLNKTLSDGEDPLDGHKMARQLWNTTFTGGLTGDIYINENGDREADFTLNDLDPVTQEMRPIATYFGARRVYENIDGAAIHWPSGFPPLDIPQCGFLDNDPSCRPVESLPVGASLSIALCIFLLLVTFVGIVLYRRIKFESQLSDLWWRVKWEDITFAENIGWKSLGSVRALEEEMNKEAIGSISNLSTLGVPPATGLKVGLYKGIKVAVKILNMKKLSVSRSVLMEIKQMWDLTHENLVRFIGLCIESPNFALLSELCPRGSLQDMLENDSINIDWVFRYSMMTDIVEGLVFLHNSTIEVHGRLKSSNCVIDGRFVVKLSGYGLKSVYDQVMQDMDSNPRSLFWCAPEHLRELEPLKLGSKKGDVYSFAIILQELIARSGPFETYAKLTKKRGGIEPEEILERVRMSTVPPFRPEVSPDSAPADLLNLMRKCWAENPDERPSMPEIKSQLKTITKGVSSKNFLDNLLNRMEQYANNLESLVEEKTKSLVEEKKKTEELLYQLLPRYVADELKKGHHVIPEAFESVTIFFSDVVGFTPLAAESTPMQVVDLLNDLYSCFDATIENYNVYKVETIGDAYMVVSGLPIRNGYEHAKEIALMSLSVRKSMGKFKIRHRNDKKLQVRIGVHSGPCAAGVVGLKMPRYCLFGDTVNTASRMESNGEAMKIHVSAETKSILDMFGAFHLSLRGDINIKGKGVMRTFWLEGEEMFDRVSDTERTIVQELDPPLQ